MKLKKIYVEAEEEIINKILEMVKPLIGEKVNAIDLCPELKEED